MAATKKKKTIPFNFGEKHKEYIRRCRYNTYNFAEGAVRAGKTIDNVFAFAHEIKTTKDKIHLATGSTMANAKLNIGDANGFGLEYIFRGQSHWGKYKDNECLYIKGPDTRNKLKVVIFAGGAKADSFKKIRGNSYGLWIATEINLHHDNTVKEAFNRSVAANNRKIFWDLNPDNPNAFIYTDYIDKYSQNHAKGILLGGYNYEHFTIDDNVNIPDKRKDEIKSQYDPNSVWYQRDILGKRVIADGLVYHMFDVEKHVVKTLDEITGGKRYVSIDYGTQNATVFLLWAKNFFGQWVCINEYYYSGRDEGEEKTDYDFADDLDNFLNGKKVPIILDPSAASFAAELTKRHYHVIDAINDVVDGIRYTSSLIKQGKISIYQGCINILKEFSSYIWDKKAGERGEDKPVKKMDHAMDAMRYFCYTILANQKSISVPDENKLSKESYWKGR